MCLLCKSLLLTFVNYKIYFTASFLFCNCQSGYVPNQNLWRIFSYPPFFATKLFKAWERQSLSIYGQLVDTMPATLFAHISFSFAGSFASSYKLALFEFRI
jgi:hypothetical protein